MGETNRACLCCNGYATWLILGPQLTALTHTVCLGKGWVTAWELGNHPIRFILWSTFTQSWRISITADRADPVTVCLGKGWAMGDYAIRSILWSTFTQADEYRLLILDGACKIYIYISIAAIDCSTQPCRLWSRKEYPTVCHLVDFSRSTADPYSASRKIGAPGFQNHLGNLFIRLPRVATMGTTRGASDWAYQSRVRVFNASSTPRYGSWTAFLGMKRASTLLTLPTWAP